MAYYHDNGDRVSAIGARHQRMPPPSGPTRERPSSRPAAAPTTGRSVVVEGHRSESSAYLTSRSTAPSVPSVATSQGNGAVRTSVPAPRPNPAAQPGGPAVLECPCHRLPCADRSAEFEDWVQHSLIHFGRAGPPMEPTCGFLCGAIFRGGDARTNWRKRMWHVKVTHHDRGQRLGNVGKVDVELYRHLWLIGKIQEPLFRDITSDPSRAYPSPPSSPPTRGAPPLSQRELERGPVAVPYNRRQEERRRNRAPNA